MSCWTMAVFSESVPVIDPAVPKEAAHALQCAPNDLIPFARPRPPAIPRTVRALVVPVIGCELTGIAIAGLAIYRLGAYDIQALHLQQVPYAVILAAMVTGFLVMLAGILGLRHWGEMRYEQRSKANAIRYHRRYVFPDTDMDGQTRTIWSRVVKATNALHRARAAREHGAIDPAWLTSVLPHHQWDIAESLARLTSLRRRQHEILASTGNPEARGAAITEALIPQQRAQELTLADIERHVQLLEDFAVQASAADAAIRLERTARQLAALDGPHGDLLAGIDSRTDWYTSDLEQATRDLRAAIDEP
jgi:hypothetical protein